MTGPIEEGAVETRGATRVHHYLLRLPQPVDRIWAAVATPGGLAGWLARAEVFEPRLDGAVELRGLGAGRITAWDVERVAEYAVEGWGRVRFHLEPGRPAGTTVRLTYEDALDDDGPDGGVTHPGAARENAADEDGKRDWRRRFERLVTRLADA